MIDFPTLYPNLVKYLPNWSERFYPSLAQFARGEGYPCGNQGVFIPRRNKCWTHPKTGQRLKKPLTYQMYKDAKEKSQRSRTEKGRTALETREQGFRDKAREKVKGWQNKKVEGTVKTEIEKLEQDLSKLNGDLISDKEWLASHTMSARQAKVDNHYKEIQSLLKRNPDDLIEVRNPSSNALERTVTIPERFKEINASIRDLYDENKYQPLFEQTQKRIATTSTTIKSLESQKKQLSKQGQISKSEPKQTPNSTGGKSAGGKSETKIGKWNNKNFSPDDYIKEKDDLADGWFREGDKGAKEKYDQWVQNSMKKKVKLTVPGDVVATPDCMNMQRSGMINKDEIETKIRVGKELETLRTTYTFPSSFRHALQLYESQKPGVRKKIKFEFDGDLPDVPSRKKDFNASLKLANFAKPGCCCEASKPLRRRKTKQTPRLKRRGNRYA